MRLIPTINDTTRKLASIQKIVAVEPCSNSENLDVASVLGWKVVVRKGEFKVGDKAIFFEVDSFIPLTPEVESLRKYSFKRHPDTGADGLRIRTVRLRGQISQGLLLPLSTYFKYREVENDWTRIPTLKELEEAKAKQPKIEEGEDLTEYLGVTKYEIIESISVDAKGTFPDEFPKSDEVRIQSCPEVLEKYKGTECYATEKIDGQSCTAYLNKNDEYGVCSRNLDLKLSDRNLFWVCTNQYNVEAKLRALKRHLAIQGEMHGSAGGHPIQGNKYKLIGLKWAVYSIYDIDNTRFLDFEEMKELLTILGIPMVPIICKKFSLSGSIDFLVQMATRKSTINSDIWEEGMVVRPLKTIIDPEFALVGGTNKTGMISFKILDPEFLIKFEV
jgi:RNA ligase (TIGR02306 family)